MRLAPGALRPSTPRTWITHWCPPASWTAGDPCGLQRTPRRTCHRSLRRPAAARAAPHPTLRRPCTRIRVLSAVHLARSAALWPVSHRRSSGARVCSPPRSPVRPKAAASLAPQPPTAVHMRAPSISVDHLHRPCFHRLHRTRATAHRTSLTHRPAMPHRPHLLRQQPLLCPVFHRKPTTRHWNCPPSSLTVPSSRICPSRKIERTYTSIS
mmetsp:Transcript_12518/g.31756  ORF Transcript_12518/g.31756 Transcript_12518/m.31756 type:complete len:211 (-) Transcript_12518:41-673(-)